MGYVILLFIHGGTEEVFGPFGSLADEELKDILKRHDLLPSFEEKVEAKCYSRPQGVSAVVWEVKSAIELDAVLKEYPSPRKD